MWLTNSWCNKSPYLFIANLYVTEPRWYIWLCLAILFLFSIKIFMRNDSSVSLLYFFTCSDYRIRGTIKERKKMMSMHVWFMGMRGHYHFQCKNEVTQRMCRELTTEKNMLGWEEILKQFRIIASIAVWTREWLRRNNAGTNSLFCFVFVGWVTLRWLFYLSGERTMIISTSIICAHLFGMRESRSLTFDLSQISTIDQYSIQHSTWQRAINW